MAFLGCWFSLPVLLLNFSPHCFPAAPYFFLGLWGWGCCLHPKDCAPGGGWRKVWGGLSLSSQVGVRGPLSSTSCAHTLPFLVWFFPAHNGVHDGRHQHWGLMAFDFLSGVQTGISRWTVLSGVCPRSPQGVSSVRGSLPDWFYPQHPALSLSGSGTQS